jgi:hypothetical protein
MAVNRHTFSPADCHLKLEIIEEEGAMGIYLYYCNSEKTLDAEKTMMPIPDDEEHAEMVFDILTNAVIGACEFHGVGGIQLAEGVVNHAAH